VPQPARHHARAAAPPAPTPASTAARSTTATASRTSTPDDVEHLRRSSYQIIPPPHQYKQVIALQTHKLGNVLAALPKSAHPGAKAALAEIYNAEDKTHALAAAKAFAADYGAKWPKAAAKITDDLNVLLAFYDYPAEHWIHLRTTNPIESTFATVRLRQRVTKGPGSRAAGIAMAFKLIESAQARWRAVNAPHLVALVRAGAEFKNGKLVERPHQLGGDAHAA
jgi:transposase-like protein